ncbi:MAG: sulfatase, partial [Planctomycetales bacterium]|nr:sulfatase [Planctomycetales bacterium]
MPRRLHFTLAAVLAVLCSASPSLAARPNILFILIDDMGWPDLGCYGHAFHETPRIDELARQGVRFTDFYATPVCSSTRGTIESGQNSARVGITDFLPGHFKPFAKLVVPPMPDYLDHALITPGEALSSAGYVTGYFGKWHLGGGPQHAPDKHGYQVTAKSLGRPFQESREPRPPGPKQMHLVTDQAIWFIRQHGSEGKPFFLHLSHHAVHIPIQAQPDTIQKYVNKPKPDHGVNHPVYAAMIEDLDTEIGRLLDTLQEMQIAENTVVVLASDNGGLRKVYTGDGQVVSTNAPLRAEKGTLYEGGIRVPLIVRWPSVTPADSVCQVPAATWDLLPTFCAMAEAKVPEQPLDGVDLTPLIRSPDQSLGRDRLYFHYPHYHHSRPASAVRHGDFKLIEWLEDGSVELYNLAEDIGEANNLASVMPDKADQLKSDLAAWRKQVGARMPTENPNYDPAQADTWWNRNTDRPLDIQ